MTAGRQSVSSTKHWCTPPDVVVSVRRVFGGQVGLDPCSNESSCVGAVVSYCLPEKDGLVEPWDASTIFVNPPYGSDKVRGTRILDWFRKAVVAAGEGSEVVMLVPVATNTTHWKECVFGVASAVCFLSASRLKFWLDGVEDPKGAPMACAVVYYGTNVDSFRAEFNEHGFVAVL